MIQEVFKIAFYGNDHCLRCTTPYRVSFAFFCQYLRGILKTFNMTRPFCIFCAPDPFLYHDETLELMMHRWMKLEKVS